MSHRFRQNYLRSSSNRYERYHVARNREKSKQIYPASIKDTAVKQKYPITKQTHAEEGREKNDLPEDETPYRASGRHVGTTSANGITSKISHKGTALF